MTTALYDELLAELLSDDPAIRRAAFVELQNHRHLHGLRVADTVCADDRGRPLVLTLAALGAHLREHGSDAHTSTTVRWYDEDTDDGYGPGLGAGPR